MNKTFIVGVILTCIGCGLIITGCVPDFNQNEYSTLAEISVNATGMKFDCYKLTASDIHVKLTHLAEVADKQNQYIRHTEILQKQTKSLVDMTYRFEQSYQNSTHSNSYCIDKLDDIILADEQIMKTQSSLKDVL